jgi:hypothetical protein
MNPLRCNRNATANISTAQSQIYSRLALFHPSYQLSPPGTKALQEASARLFKPRRADGKLFNEVSVTITLFQ